MDLFKKKYPDAKLYVVSALENPNSGCISLKEFLNISPEILL